MLRLLFRSALLLCIAQGCRPASGHPLDSSAPRSPAASTSATPAPIALDERVVSYKRQIEARVGRPVRLTIRPELQAGTRAAVEKTGKVAAALVVDVDSGAVLAAYSRLEEGPDPLLEAIVPGCTLKPILGLAGLEEGVVEESSERSCDGSYRTGGQVIQDFDKHGAMTLRTALATSCDSFFLAIVDKVGLDGIARYAHQFGFGQPTGIELAEPPGAVPTSAAYPKDESGVKRRLASGTGHGEFRATLFQLARAYAAIATGRLVPLHLIDGGNREPGGAGRPLPYKPEHLAAVRNGLRATVDESFGTAANVALANLRFSGKTGSIWEADGAVLGLFAAYAPAESPEVAVVGLVRRGRRATFSAAPLVRDVLENWYKTRPARQRDVN